MIALLLSLAALLGAGEARPNVVWITIDDCGPDFGCYGDDVVATPHLDALAARGQRFDRAFASTPVCSPVRSGLITGCYATTIGSHQHRSARPLRAPYRPVTELLAEAGWRPTFLPTRRVTPEEFASDPRGDANGFPNVSGSNKQDFNFSRGEGPLFEGWDEAARDEPFFALIDFHAPKNGQGTGRAHDWAQRTGRAVDPDALDLPPYWVDDPSVRAAYARYYEGVALLDAEIGALFDWLEAAELAERTHVFVLGDHGIAMLRHKQWCYDGGLHVPLLVAGPGIEAGVARSELVSSIDLAATTLGLCGVEAPAWMEGRDFLDPDLAPREHVFASRDRCDETEDRVRAIRTERWKLIRNLRPDLSWVGRNLYTGRAFPNVPLYAEGAAAGTLEPLQAAFAATTKPEWELYDLERDPLELDDLADRPEHAEVLAELRAELEDWIEETDAHNPFPEALATVSPERVAGQVGELRASEHGLTDRPNVVLVLADDLGWGDLGCYGQERILTPHLDRLASEGVRFTQMYSGHCVCAPSRCVLLTGLHTGHAQIRNNSPWASAENPLGEGQEPLARDTPNLARWFSERGYATACIGKWGLGGPGTSGAPNLQGFDRFFGYLCQKQAHDYYPAHLWRDATRVELDNPGFTPRERWEAPPEDPAAYAAFSGSDYACDRMLDETLAWVRERGDEPFFLYLPSPIPHVALQVPEQDLAVYDDRGWDDGPYLGERGYVPHPAPRAAHAAMISRLDRDVGRVLALLDELEIADDTIVLFTSDNGPTNAGGASSTWFGSAGGLRGMKGSLYEGGIRVPAIARWPARLPAGVELDVPAGFQDVWPTLAAALGSPVGGATDGVSLLGALEGRDARLDERALYWESGRQQALRHGDWKIVRRRAEDGTDRVELFDVESDPTESIDRGDDEPERLRAMLERLDAARSPSARFPSPFDGSEPR